LDESLLKELHARICGELIPDLAGRWRLVNVQVGRHVAPAFHEVPTLMRDYCLDVRTRLDTLSGDEMLIEHLAFAEGRLLSIHPFEDFNGRVTRVFLAELLRRLNLPAVTLAPDAGLETTQYLAALRAADQNDFDPLIAFWRQRFEKGTET
jgi:CRISPR-associated endonuclease/helicase Cas3